jgi:Ca2+/H+ antiporter, TMEM165/GDT1 family
MKFRRRPAPLLLLLLPSLAATLSAAAQDNIESTLTKNTQPREARIDPKASPIVDLNTKPKYEIGTKDAPVDGKDGKPHAGPFVGTEKDPKKPKVADEDSEFVAGKDDLSKMVTSDGTKIPAVNDGVMDDPHRQLPKQGTTGTEGGVSEKDKARKAQEGQTGERLEKKPDSPKEAPPLPQSEDKKYKSEKAKSKDINAEDEDDGEGLGGLEV